MLGCIALPAFSRVDCQSGSRKIQLDIILILHLPHTQRCAFTFSSLAAPIILLFCICTYAKRWTLNAEWSPFRTFASCDLRWILLITQDRHKISPLMLSRGLLLILVSQTPSQLSSLRSAVSMARTWWLDLSVMSVDEGARPPPSELSDTSFIAALSGWQSTPSSLLHDH